MNSVWLGMAVTIAATSSNQYDDYAQAWREARESNRPILLLFQDSAGTQLISERSDSKEHQDLLSQYVVCRVNVATVTGRKLATAVRATQVPYTIIGDQGGKQILYRRAGGIPEGEWVTLLKTYVKGKPRDRSAAQPVLTSRTSKIRTSRQVYQPSYQTYQPSSSGRVTGSTNFGTSYQSYSANWSYQLNGGWSGWSSSACST